MKKEEPLKIEATENNKKLRAGVAKLLSELYPKSTGYYLAYMNDEGQIEFAIAARNQIAASIFAGISNIVGEELNKIANEQSNRKNGNDK